MLVANYPISTRAGLFTLLAILAGVTPIACGDAKEASAPETLLVRSTLITDGAGGRVTRFTGEIRPRFEAQLGFQVGGKLVDRPVDVGARVTRGDVLAVIEDTDLRLSVDAARSAVAAASAELERARADEARYRDLLERGLTTGAAYLTQQTAVKTARSRLEQLTADLRLSEQRLSYALLKADDDGVVTETLAEAGAVVAAGQPILSVARAGELEAVFDVPDSRIDEIRAAAALDVSFLSDSGASYTAAVREISPSADPVTRTFRVRATIHDAPETLRLGMSVTVTLEGGAGLPAVALPATALFQTGDRPAVWIIADDLTLELRPVEVERYDSDFVFVSNGVTAGERVVTAGVHRLAAGERVRLMDEVRP